MKNLQELPKLSDSISYLYIEHAIIEQQDSVMVYSSPNEQGFEMKVHGDPKRRVTDFEGVQLITVMNGQDEQHKENCLPGFPFEITFSDE